MQISMNFRSSENGDWPPIRQTMLKNGENDMILWDSWVPNFRQTHLSIWWLVLPGFECVL